MILVLTAVVCPQKLPDKILGYKVQAVKSLVTTAPLEPAADADIMIRVVDMTVSHIGLLGATVNIQADILAKSASGKIERIMFRDLTINGVAVDVDDVIDDFEFEKGTQYSVDRSVHVGLSPVNAVRAGFSQLMDGRTHWDIAGTMFVFCRVKKFGFTFKRAIPIKFSLKVKNPLL